MQNVFPRPVRVFLMTLLAMSMAGCAAQMAYRDGVGLLEQNKIEQGIAKFNEAAARDPANAQYRIAHLHARDLHAKRLIDSAQREREQGRIAQARTSFQRALLIDPGNDRALQGLRDMDVDKRLDDSVAESLALVQKKEYAHARTRLDRVLTERPTHAAARNLLAEIDSLIEPPTAPTGVASAYRLPVTIEFRDAPLRQVFEVLSRRSGLNFVFDKDVRSDLRTSIFLRNSTVDAAIYFLLVTNQLEQQVMDENTILIFPNVDAKVKEYRQLVVKTFFLANAEAKTVAGTLKQIMKARDIAIDEKLNLVIVRDSEDAIRTAERLVALLDVAEAEVMLEVEILEVKRSRLTDLGISWPDSLAFAPLTTSTANPLTITQLRNLSSNAIGVSGVAATLNANKIDADTNILANPRIRVRNKEKAKIMIGEKVPNIITTISPGSGGFASESVSYVDVGLTLNVEPTIYLNDEVGIRIALEVSSLVDKQTTKSGTVAYQIGTRQASTFLQLKDGENQVLAGLINNEERSNGRKVPGAGDLPFLGRLFGSTLDDTQKTEIVLSITPHLVRNVQRPPADSSEFNTGTESGFRRRPATHNQPSDPVSRQVGNANPALDSAPPDARRQGPARTVARPPGWPAHMEFPPRPVTRPSMGPGRTPPSGVLPPSEIGQELQDTSVPTPLPSSRSSVDFPTGAQTPASTPMNPPGQ